MKIDRRFRRPIKYEPPDDDVTASIQKILASKAFDVKGMKGDEIKGVLKIEEIPKMLALKDIGVKDIKREIKGEPPADDYRASSA
jgi:hypothetical protein